MLIPFTAPEETNISCKRTNFDYVNIKTIMLKNLCWSTFLKSLNFVKVLSYCNDREIPLFSLRHSRLHLRYTYKCIFRLVTLTKSLREFITFAPWPLVDRTAKSPRPKRLCKRTYSCTDECDHACVNDTEVWVHVYLHKVAFTPVACFYQ